MAVLMTGRQELQRGYSREYPYHHPLEGNVLSGFTFSQWDLQHYSAVSIRVAFTQKEGWTSRYSFKGFTQRQLTPRSCLDFGNAALLNVADTFFPISLILSYTAQGEMVLALEGKVGCQTVKWPQP